MQSGALLYQGAELMLVGMGTVFLFLTLLVLATTALSRLVVRLAPVPPANSLPAANRAAADPATGHPDDELIAVIGAAIRLHRTRQR